MGSGAVVRWSCALSASMSRRRAASRWSSCASIMSRRTASASFLSSPRNFDWQVRREVNSGPVVLHGCMKRHLSPDSSGWSGLSLKPEAPLSPRRSVATRAWNEFLSAKRTVDPSYPVPASPKRLHSPTRPTSPANLQAFIDTADSQDLVWNSRGTVQVNGKAVYPNATSDDNVLKQSESGVYRGRKVAGSTSPVNRRMKRANSISVERGQSQIQTLPGSRRVASSYAQSPKMSLKPDFESHISGLPGTLVRVEQPAMPFKPLSKVHRNITTSAENEHFYGPSPPPSGPKTLIQPKGEGYHSFKSSPPPKGKHHIPPAANRILHETVKQPHFARALRAKPNFVKDLFGNTFKLG